MGGHRLTGAIEPSGNKNAALPIIAAPIARKLSLK
jgi:UDP-N-acetylglucosamine 1-carboxyvinyltransferase